MSNKITPERLTLAERIERFKEDMIKFHNLPVQILIDGLLISENNSDILLEVIKYNAGGEDPFTLTLEQTLSNSKLVRTKHFVYLRQIFHYMVIQMGYSNRYLVTNYGMDHASILHSCKKVEAALDEKNGHIELLALYQKIVKEYEQELLRRNRCTQELAKNNKLIKY